MDNTVVKSHITTADIDINMSAEHRTGNALADHWAGGAASILQSSEQQDNIQKDVDFTAWIIQSRMVAIYQSCLESHNRTGREPMATRTAEQVATIRLEKILHILVLSGEW